MVTNMVYSMTGYGRASQTLEGKEITVELRSVNHRFFECSVRVPRNYGYLEEKLRAYCKERISRGKLDVSVSLAATAGAGLRVEANRELAAAYVKELRATGAPLGMKDDLSLSTLLQLPDLFSVRREEEDEEQIWALVQQVAEQALSQFMGMRRTEGANLREDLLANIAQIDDCRRQIEERSPQINEQYRQRLVRRMEEVLGQAGVEEQRILTEAAIFAEKTAVDEETVRLSSHIAQFREILEREEPVGRSLEFLLQEFHREANTIGSKVQDVQAARIVVEIKGAIERIREQIQNIE